MWLEMVLALKFQNIVEGKHSIVIFLQKPPKNIIGWPYLHVDSLLQQFNMRFGDLARQTIWGLYLIPSYAVREPVNPDELLHYYRADMPSPDTIISMDNHVEQYKIQHTWYPFWNSC